MRITGLRIRGPDPKDRTADMRRRLKEGGRKLYYALANSDGLQCDHRGLEVDNCEWSARSHAAVYLRKAATRVPGLATTLRQQGIHARFSYKTTRNVGKLLKEAANTNARFAVIVEDDAMQLKDLKSGEQAPITANDLLSKLNG